MSTQSSVKEGNPLSDPWWRRRKKKNPWFNDIYDELERIGEMIDETMQRFFDNFSENSPVRRNPSQGFSMKLGRDGKPSIREINSHRPMLNETELIDDIDPLVDIVENGQMLVVLVALPGINKDDIDIRVTENCLTVTVDTEDFEWYDELNLPTKVKPKTARASYKNGVLEVRLEKLEKLIRDGKISVKK